MGKTVLQFIWTVKVDYIAHISEKKTFQTVKEHSISTANLAKDFAIPECKDIVFLIGLLHDIGKYQPSFQKKITENNAIRIGHALCGAQESEKRFGQNLISLIVQYCIAGHHSGLPDAGTSFDRKDPDNTSSLYAILGRETENYTAYKNDLEDLLEKNILDEKVIKNLLCTLCDHKNPNIKIQLLTDYYAFLVRYCFSCLTDADSLDTESFCTGIKRTNKTSNFEECLKIINRALANFTAKTELQKARSKIQSQVYDKINEHGQIFLMNMPTGSGKTLCSMKFALERLIKNKKKKIIYIIPYNSIIDQTANEFEKIFADKLNIVRHQSSFSYEELDDYTEDYKEWAKKVCENWDADFIITTAVQFFESIYGNKRGKLRKLHNMENAILIFDEAHLMPIEFLEPCLKGIAHIVKLLNSEALFLTATMPNFENIFTNYIKDELKIVNLITEKELFKNFKKCTYSFCDFLDIESLLLAGDKQPSRLIVANTKKTARDIYNQASGEKYHLSTYIIGKDRIETIKTIKKRIKQLENDFIDSWLIPEERRITVVSTSLIEAGVDLDFHSVYRELNGLDNALQASGRCNREGFRKSSKTYIFELEENKKKAKTPEQVITKNLISEFSDIDTSECIETYYSRLLISKADEIAKHSLYKSGQKPYLIPFRTYLENFNLISDSSISIVVPIDEKIEEIYKQAQFSHSVPMSKIQNYVASVSKQEFNELLKQRVLEDYGTGVFFLTNLDYYSSELGLTLEGKDFYY